MPALGSRNGVKIRRHAETVFLVVAPPTRESRQFGITGMALVHEAAGDAARTAVEVFVAASDREIDVPVV